MGIFEKIFEIGNTMLDVIQACGNSIPRETYGVVQDPFEMFVKTLSQTPNSQRQYANLLLAKVIEKPEIQRFSQHLTSGLSELEIAPPVTMDLATSAVAEYGIGGLGLMPLVLAPQQWKGSILGEISDDETYKVDEDSVENQTWSECVDTNTI